MSLLSALQSAGLENIKSIRFNVPESHQHVAKLRSVPLIRYMVLQCSKLSLQSLLAQRQRGPDYQQYALLQRSAVDESERAEQQPPTTTVAVAGSQIAPPHPPVIAAESLASGSETCNIVTGDKKKKVVKFLEVNRKVVKRGRKKKAPVMCSLQELNNRKRREIARLSRNRADGTTRSVSKLIVAATAEANSMKCNSFASHKGRLLAKTRKQRTHVGRQEKSRSVVEDTGNRIPMARQMSNKKTVYGSEQIKLPSAVEEHVENLLMREVKNDSCAKQNDSMDDVRTILSIPRTPESMERSQPSQLSSLPVTTEEPLLDKESPCMQASLHTSTGEKTANSTGKATLTSVKSSIGDIDDDGDFSLGNGRFSKCSGNVMSASKVSVSSPKADTSLSNSYSCEIKTVEEGFVDFEEKPREDCTSSNESRSRSMSVAFDSNSLAVALRDALTEVTTDRSSVVLPTNMEATAQMAEEQSLHRRPMFEQTSLAYAKMKKTKPLNKIKSRRRPGRYRYMKRIRRHLPNIQFPDYLRQDLGMKFKETFTSLVRRDYSHRKINTMELFQRLSKMPIRARDFLNLLNANASRAYRQNWASDLRVRSLMKIAITPRYVKEHMRQFQKPPFRPYVHIRSNFYD